MERGARAEGLSCAFLSTSLIQGHITLLWSLPGVRVDQLRVGAPRGHRWDQDGRSLTEGGRSSC